MKDRIRQLMEAQHMNQQTFATCTGISTASLSSIFTGRTRPTLNHVDAILEKFPNVNPLWLLKGTGGMMLSSDDNATASGSTTDGTPEGSQNTSAPGFNSALQSSANMTVEPTLFSNPNAGTQQRISTPNAGAKIPSSFHFETEQKVVLPQRKITEIRIFYDDQTWETFVPKKEK